MYWVTIEYREIWYYKKEVESPEPKYPWQIRHGLDDDSPGYWGDVDVAEYIDKFLHLPAEFTFNGD